MTSKLFCHLATFLFHFFIVIMWMHSTVIKWIYFSIVVDFHRDFISILLTEWRNSHVFCVQIFSQTYKKKSYGPHNNCSFKQLYFTFLIWYNKKIFFNINKNWWWDADMIWKRIDEKKWRLQWYDCCLVWKYHQIFKRILKISLS